MLEKITNIQSNNFTLIIKGTNLKKNTFSKKKTIPDESGAKFLIRSIVIKMITRLKKKKKKLCIYVCMCVCVIIT